MLSPKLSVFSITPEIREKIQDKVFDALFRSITSLPPRRMTRGGVPSITVSEAKERLEMGLPEYADAVGAAFPAGRSELGVTAREFGERLHEWIEEASLFFRREGAQYIREALSLPNAEDRRIFLWRRLFDERLLSLARSGDMLGDEGAMRTCDLLMESMKLWTGYVASHLSSGDPADFEPAAVFLDTETDIEGEIRRDGSVIHLRGRPDAVFFDQRRSEVHVWEYKFGRQGLFELQVAQTLLYMALIESVKGVTTAGGQLVLFSVEVEEASESAAEEASRVSFPPKVERAFEGFIGNEQAVYLLKMELTLALKQNPPRFRKNILLCGPGGTGKTELARRVAGALGTPFVDVPATAVSGLDDLMSKVDAVLAHEGMSAVEDGTDPHSGKPFFRYPPVLVFMDEVHALKKPDAFLNLLETKDRRAVCKDKSCDLKDAAFLAATTEKGKLFKPFLSRFRVIDLQRYTLREVAAIARLVFADCKKDCPEEVAELLAKVGRLTPRTVKIRAEDFIGYHEVDPHLYPISGAGVREAMTRAWNVDPNGLTPTDREYLEAVSAGPRGISALTKLLPCAREEIENVIEPYLLQLGAVRHTSRGREITEIGRSLLNGL